MTEHGNHIEEGHENHPRPFLQIMFQCCGVYQRIYRDREGRNYSGRCPRCLRPVRFKVGANGTSERAFLVR